jgi:Amino acid permease
MVPRSTTLRHGVGAHFDRVIPAVARRVSLYAAFAFTVMADPVSSVAYAIEAALHRLSNDLADIVLTMGLVMATIAVVAVGYHQLIGRFPRGGGGAQGLAEAFGEGWAFLPLGALLVDFALTIAVSCAAAASALIAYSPALGDARVALAVGLAVVVAFGSAAGHRGRVVFANATLLFVALAAWVLARGIGADAGPASAPAIADAGVGAAALAMPLGMALATGVEAPSNAIAQLDQLDDRGRRRAGRLTLWLMVGLVGVLTLGLAAAAAGLGIRGPSEDSTLLADVAQSATGGDDLFGAFQAATALLLLAAAASAYLAGSGLLEALARGPALLPRRFAVTNRFYAPPWGIASLAVAAALLIALAEGREQELVKFYAVAVFASFLGALTAAARLAWRDGRRLAFMMDAIGVALIAFVLALNLARTEALIVLGASTVLSLALWRRWVARGRPSGVAQAAR